MRAKIQLLKHRINQTLSKVFSGAQPLTWFGPGTLTLTGANTYTGDTTVNGGTLELYNPTAYNSAITVSSGATLKLSNTAYVGGIGNAPTSLASGATLIHNGLTDNNDYIVLDGAVTVSGSTTINQFSVTNTNAAVKNLFFDGGLKGTGTVTINATNPGNGVTFRNNNTDFAGTLIVNGIASAISNSGSGIAVGGTTTGLQNADITLNGTMELLNLGIGWAANVPGIFKMGALNGSGVVVANFNGIGGAGGFTLGNTNVNGDFSGVIANGSGNTANLTKIGTGTQILRGTNTYTGPTTVSAGTLEIGGSGTLGSGTYSGNISIAGAFVYNSSSSQTLSGLVTGSGTFTKNGSGTLTLTQETNGYPSHLFDGAIAINSGTLVTADVSFGLNFVASITINGGTLNVQTQPSEQHSLYLNGGSIVSTGLANTTFGNILLSQNSTGIHAGGSATSTIAVSQVSLWGANSIDVSASSTLIISGVVAEWGTSSLTKTGSGTLTLSGANTYTGTTTVSAGTLTISNASGLGTGAVTVNGTLTYTVNTTGTRTVTVNSGGVINKGGFSHTGTTFVNNGGTINA